MMIGPTTPKSTALRYAVDNGAFPAFSKGKSWDEGQFLKLLDKIETFERRPDFACCPDIVAGGLKSLDFSMSWMGRLPASYPWYLAVQDGMTEADVEPVLSQFGGIFVGGTTDFKMSSCPVWAHLARRMGKRMHVGRVNTLMRAFTIGKVFGADSFDGNNWNRTWSHDRTKDGRPIYFGRTLRHKDTAKPIDVVQDSQMSLDLFGIASERRKADMLNLATRQFVRAKTTFTWHEAKKAEDTKLRVLCGRLFRHPDVKGKEPEYDKRKTSPPRFSKWCIECQQAHNKLRGKV